MSDKLPNFYHVAFTAIEHNEKTGLLNRKFQLTVTDVQAESPEQAVTRAVKQHTVFCEGTDRSVITGQWVFFASTDDDGKEHWIELPDEIENYAHAVPYARRLRLAGAAPLLEVA